MEDMPESHDNAIRYAVEDPDIVKTDVLDPIEYDYGSHRGIDITIRQPEFTSLCPMTGLPDVGCITITYRPDRTIIELKSLKFYLMQYRNVGIFYEHLVNRILDDMVSILKPRRMEITGEFMPRGGMTTRVTAVHPNAA